MQEQIPFGISGRKEQNIKQNLSISLAVTPDGMWIVSGSDDTTIRIWEMEYFLMDTDDRLRMEEETGISPLRITILLSCINALILTVFFRSY